MKVSPEEEALLLQLAASQRVTIPRLLVESALAGGAETSSQRRNAIEELFAVHRLLAQVSNNVNQIARATNATLEAQPETYATLAALRRVAERVGEAAEALIVEVGQMQSARLDRMHADPSRGAGRTGGASGAGGGGR